MEYARFARELSRKASRAVRASLGLPEHLDPVVKRADSILLATERRDLMAPSVVVDWGPLPDPLSEVIRPHSITTAEMLWRGMWLKHSGSAW